MKGRLKIFFILDNDIYFHPKMLSDIAADKRYDWAGVGILTKDVLTPYLIKNLFKVGLYSAARIALIKYRRLFYSRLITPLSKIPVTVEDVAKKYGIKYFYMKNPNDENSLAIIGLFSPDIIISSCSQIFKKKLLSIPNIACINRHSGLLPSYAGILPVFQAIAHGENQIGVTIHYMDEGIDSGGVIIQEPIELAGKRKSLFALYERCFNLSAGFIIAALEAIKSGKKSCSKNIDRKPSYFSFPAPKHWRMFKEDGGRFI